MIIEMIINYQLRHQKWRHHKLFSYHVVQLITEMSVNQPVIGFVKCISVVLISFLSDIRISKYHINLRSSNVKVKWIL